MALRMFRCTVCEKETLGERENAPECPACGNPTKLPLGARLGSHVVRLSHRSRAVLDRASAIQHGGR